MSVLLMVRKRFGTIVPASFRSFVLRHFSLLDRRTAWWESKDPYRNMPPCSDYPSPYPIKLGIVKEFWHRHINYIAACREMKISYQLVDITADDWIEQFKNSDCDAFLVHPSVQMSQWKNLFDERLKIVTQVLGKTIFPGHEELWLYESKRRMAYWLEANGFPHAKTRVFYNKDAALKYANECDLPVVAKTNMGARAAGVQVIRNRKKLCSYIKRAFGRGLIHDDGDPHDPDWGQVIFQQFIPCLYEWRIINIGPYYMGHQKLKKGDFCSGSDMVGWIRPPDNVLRLVSEVLEKGGFQTADVDVFQGADGNLYINEIQALFGSFLPYQMLDNGEPGYLTKEPDGQWFFHRGICCQNASCNFRIATVLQKLGYDVSLPSLPDSSLDPEHVLASKQHSAVKGNGNGH